MSRPARPHFPYAVDYSGRLEPVPSERNGGGYANVYQYRDTLSGRVYAVKELKELRGHISQHLTLSQVRVILACSGYVFGTSDTM